jgi:hypothetical protein
VTRGARRSVLVIGLTAVLLALVGPAPAAAHIGSGTSPTNARSVITDIRPAVPGVEATIGLGGQFVRVSNRGADQVVVLGYRDEPFLRLSQQRVQVDAGSTTAAQTGLLPPGLLVVSYGVALGLLVAGVRLARRSVPVSGPAECRSRE